MNSRVGPGREVGVPDYQQGLSLLRRRLTRVELLLAAGCVIAIVLVLMNVYERLTSGLVAHDNAANFAGTIRRAQTLARDSNSYIRLRINPASPSQPSQYVIEDGTRVLEQKSFPRALFVAGEATLDPHGVPLSPASFQFRCCDSHLQVNIDERGIVSIP